MRDRDFQFLSIHLNTAVREDRFQIISDMVKYIKLCVDPRYGGADRLKEFSEFRRSVDAQMFNFSGVPGNVKIDDAKERESTIQMLIDAISEMKQYSAVETMCITHFTDITVRHAIKTEIGAVEVAWEQPRTPSVYQAFRIAMDNFIRIETGLVYLGTLFKLLRSSPYVQLELPGADEVRGCLYKLRDQFMINILVFGGLCGGEEQKIAVRIGANSLVYNPKQHDMIPFSVIEFLQPFGRHPGIHDSDYSEAFMTDIIGRYKEI